MKRNLISQKKTERKGNPRFYVRRVERLCSRFNHFGYSSCVSCLSLSLCLPLSLSPSLSPLAVVSVSSSLVPSLSASLQSPVSAVSASLDSERLLAFVAVLFNKFYGLSCVKWKWEFMCL